MDFQTTILSALLPKTQADKENTDLAIKEVLDYGVNSQNFTNGHRFLFETVLEQYAKQSILDREVFETYLIQRSISDEIKVQYRILFATCREASTDIEKLKEILPSFLQQKNTEDFGNILTDAIQILVEGKQVDKRSLKGLEDAKKHLITRISGLEKYATGRSPQGEISKTMPHFWELYNEAATNPNVGVLSGIKEIDVATKGIRKGEVFTCASYSKHGKSQWLRTWAYNGAINQGKNVVFATIEMTRDQILNNFVSLHSTHSKFGNPLGVPVVRIADGNLIGGEKENLQSVTEDLQNNPNYGILYLLQLEDSSTISSLKQKLLYLKTLFKIDLLVLDYATLLKSDSMRQTTIQEVTDIYKSLKQLGLNFYDGDGLAILNAHQTSRAALEKALKSEAKRYEFGFTSDAVESERSSDCLLWLLRTDEMIQRREVKIGMSLFRRAPVMPDITIAERYDCSLLHSLGPTKITDNVFEL